MSYQVEVERAAADLGAGLDRRFFCFVREEASPDTLREWRLAATGTHPEVIGVLCRRAALTATGCLKPNNQDVRPEEYLASWRSTLDASQELTIAWLRDNLGLRSLWVGGLRENIRQAVTAPGFPGPSGWREQVLALEADWALQAENEEGGRLRAAKKCSDLADFLAWTEALPTVALLGGRATLLTS